MFTTKSKRTINGWAKSVTGQKVWRMSEPHFNTNFGVVAWKNNTMSIVHYQSNARILIDLKTQAIVNAKL